MTRQRIKGGFAAIRNGLRDHLPSMAECPEAVTVYLWCHLNTRNKGPEAGVVRLYTTQMAEEWDWSRQRVQRAVSWLCDHPSPSKPYLVKIRRGSRHKPSLYYIRNYHGDDAQSSDVSVTSAGGDKGEQTDHSVTSAGGEVISIARASVHERAETRSIARASVHERAETNLIYARASDVIRKTEVQRGVALLQEEEVGQARQFKIEHVFDSQQELEEYLREVTFAGLPEALLEQAMAKALEAPHTYGVALRGGDEETQDAEVGG